MQGLTQAQLMEMLEPVIDANTVGSVLLAIARVCDEKAEHIVINWQDKQTARPWQTLARRLDKLANDTHL